MELTREHHTLTNRPCRTLLLHEMERATGLHGKSLVRAMHGDPKGKLRRKQLGRTYEPRVDDAIRAIW